MHMSEIASRLTGISCPVFGISWNPPESDITIAKRVVAILEDRRVLYSPSELEVPDHCVRSIIEIRKFLTSEIGKADVSESISENLRAMRAACRKFLDRIQADEKIVPNANYPGHYATWEFMDALGQLRGTFGVHLAQLAVKYGVDVEDDLARILPNSDSESGREA